MIGVLCTDERMTQIADNLSIDCSILYIDEHTDFLLLPMLDALILPVKGIDAYGYVVFKEQRIHIPRNFWNIQSINMRVYCGLPCDGLNNIKQPITYYMLDEEVIEQNAILTAEGVLYEIIASVCKSIYSLQVDIIGYGHCGKAIYKMLKALDMKTNVVRRASDDKIACIAIKDWDMDADIIVNTAPINVLEKEHLIKCKKPCVLLDIASDANFHSELLATYQITYRKLPNLPGRFACISAGNIIAEFIRGRNNGK